MWRQEGQLQVVLVREAVLSVALIVSGKMDEVDVYDFDNEVVSPAERQPKVRQCNKYQEFLNENLPFMRVRWSYLPVGLLRLKCKEKWLKITGRTAGGHKQQPAQPKRPRRRVSFNESAEVRRIGASQSQSHPQRSRRPSHFSPLKSEPAVSSANRCRKTSIEVIPDPDDWAHSESPISRRMQQLEIGRRGSDAAGGDQPAVSDHTIHFPDTPVFENTTPPTSPQLIFSRSRSSASRSADSSVLFSCKQRTYTGFSSRRDEQPVPADENSRDSGCTCYPEKKNGAVRTAAAQWPLPEEVVRQCVRSSAAAPPPPGAPAAHIRSHPSHESQTGIERDTQNAQA